MAVALLQQSALGSRVIFLVSQGEGITMVHDRDDITRLERDGYVVLEGILPADQVEQARQELAVLFDQDAQSRASAGLIEPYRSDGPIGATILTKPSHLALDVYNRSPAFDALLEQMLTHPRVRSVVSAWSGPATRAGAYWSRNARRAHFENRPRLAATT
ncbi:phytanoyl-CoA dioxygenase family protein [Bradyrhizobium sp. 62B]|uniref:phytanoyl-CoA dioxygenase family protein n=1 Tax=Bradyrhizobium sp. 62B TaxID=2898442 RepID=UPI0025581988|nr:phytanoyl-CoA dioxygenase family protein [Bradyrhizobium sp. 62B]